MTQSVYVIGGAGTGKSTFTAALLERVGAQMGSLTDLHQKPNSRGTVITLRGHHVTGEPGDGLYLGCMRDAFPGTDGLDRVSYIPGEAWLQTAELPDWIVGEGATLAVRRFLAVLNETTDLLVVWLEAEDWLKELRFFARGSDQDPRFVLSTATRSHNLAADLVKNGVRVWSVDSGDPVAWDEALHAAVRHLEGSIL